MTGAKLTALRVRSLTAPGRYSDGGGLYLQVRDADARSWLFRYKRDGRGHWVGLGPARDVTLAEAREKARDLRRAILDGRDPLAERRALAPVQTFRQVAAQYIASHKAGWANAKHSEQWANTLAAYAYPIFGETAVSKVDTGHVMRALEPIWREKPETASRVRGRVESVLDYAKARGWRSAENPARWRGHLDNLLPARSRVARVEHHAALPYDEAPAFMAALRAREATAARALEFTILTAARTSEVVGARWREIDLEAAVWTVPGARMKAKREHRVPLTDAAQAVLRAVQPPNGADPEAYVFPGPKPGRPLSTAAMAALLERMGRAEITVHGFRSTFRDWAAEQTGHPREIAEAALAHTVKDKVEAAYRRGDLFEKRRLLMEDWARYLA